MTHKLFIIALGVLLTFTACKKEDDGVTTTSITTQPTSNSSNRIMALGASRVEGDRPNFESFRFELWKKMIEGGWDVDFIGTENDLASYPTLGNRTFDNDHEGRGGWTSGQILDGIGGWLNATGAPDIVLFSSPGGNDALEGLSIDNAIANANSIIDIIQGANPNVTIIIEQMAPARSDQMTSELTAAFNQMKQGVLDMANQQTTNQSKVIAVDMFTGFTDAMLADEVHYNEAGARFIADRYYEVLTSQGILKSN